MIARVLRHSLDRRRNPLILSLRRLQSAASARISAESGLNDLSIPSAEPRSPHPSVVVAPGEVLLYEGGWATRRTIVTTSFATMTVWGYVGLNASLLWRTPELALLSPNALAGFAGFAALVTAMAYGGSRAAMRYAVLSADGLSLRLYPYGAIWGLGVGAPVSVPVKLLSVGESVRRAFTGVDSSSLFVGVAGSAVQLTFDKPEEIAAWVGGAGSGLMWGAKGLLGAIPRPHAQLLSSSPPPPSPSVSGGGGGVNAAGLTDASVSPALVSPTMLYALPASQRSALRRYALLCHVLRGNPVAVPRLASGEWELEAMAEQLDPGRGRKPAETRIAELRYWREARDLSDGRPYWYHVVNWARQWTPPLVEGRGPREYHPDLPALPPLEQQ